MSDNNYLTKGWHHILSLGLIFLSTLSTAQDYDSRLYFETGVGFLYEPMESAFPNFHGGNSAASYIIPVNPPEWFWLWHRTKGLMYSMGVTKKIHRRMTLRSGIQYNVNNQQLYAKKTLEYAIGSSTMIYAIHDLEVPMDIKYDIRPWLQMFGGLSVNFRINAHKPESVGIGPPDERWPISERKENLAAVKDFFRPVLFKYRYGLGIKPFRRVIFEVFYQHPFGNVIVNSFNLRGESYPVDISYGYLTFRALYKFRLPFLLDN